ncbi:hypothetical protein FE257_005799 [Aspergillus nanangensis]|uniref:Uncharacterized protein n=1 Tax=Aspergillus nanangensis TaxID=2582783 RepID=A0AAD4CAF6_ASPNN|nr:hypothetical protein FE257_005799 [Aspergillus nanangensis]
MAHTLEFASSCDPQDPIKRIEVILTSVTENVRVWDMLAANPWKKISCPGHMLIVFTYGDRQVAATKHAGYDLIWHHNIPAHPLKKPALNPSLLCPYMKAFAFKMSAYEYPEARNLDCSEFVDHFINKYTAEGYICGELVEFKEFLRMQRGQSVRLN